MQPHVGSQRLGSETSQRVCAIDTATVADAVFIASARTDIPLLLKEIERLNSQLKIAELPTADEYIQTMNGAIRAVVLTVLGEVPSLGANSLLDLLHQRGVSCTIGDLRVVLSKMKENGELSVVRIDREFHYLLPQTSQCEQYNPYGGCEQ